MALQGVCGRLFAIQRRLIDHERFRASSALGVSPRQVGLVGVIGRIKPSECRSAERRAASAPPVKVLCEVLMAR
jgi:hypothetical protein